MPDNKAFHTHKHSLLIALCAISLIAGCSSKQVYEGIQKNRQLHCEHLQGSQLEECMQQYDTNYDTYKQQRDSATR